MTTDRADSAGRWETVTALFGQAVALPPAERAAFVASACGDEDLRAELLSLLAAYDRAPGFFTSLERTVADAAAAPLAEAAYAPAMNGGQIPPEAPAHYERLERIGAGGMGAVYRARDTRLDRWVALKFVSAERVGDSAARRRLIREARAASALDHPAICPVYAIEQSPGGEICIAMAYCAGGTLQDRLTNPLPVDETLRIVRDVAAGLAKAHGSGLVHRDLKPGNIGFTEDGRARLLDFGLCVREAPGSTSAASRTAGTIAYMAPEQLRGRPADARTDVWSLGVTMYEMLAGRRPFQAPDDASTMYAVLEHEPAPLDAVRPDAPPWLAELVGAMLRRDPDARPADGAAVLRALEPQALEEPAAARPLATIPKVRPRARAIVALVALIAAALLAWRTWGAPTGAPPATPDDAAGGDEPRQGVAVLPFAVRGGPELAYLREGMVDLLAATLDGVGGLRGIDPNAVLGVAPRGAEPVGTGAARAAAARLGASRYVLGAIVQVGDGMQLTAALYDSAGRERARARTVIPGDSALVAGVDDLARQLVASELTAPGERLAGLAAMTTPSLPALRAYLDGERLLRDARPEAAIARFAEAVERDTMFALAWYRLARAAGWRQMDSLNTVATRRAIRHANGLPPRIRRIVDAYHQLRSGDPREAERRLRAIVDEHPDDAESWILLGEALFHNNPSLGRPTNEAREPLQRAMMLDARNREVTVHLMDLAARERRLGALDTLFRMYFSPNSEGEEPGVRHAYIALHATLLGDSARGDAVLARLQEAGDEAMRVALVRVAPQLGDVEWASALARRLASPLSPTASRVEGLLNVALLEASRGRWQSAERAWREADGLAAGLALAHRAWAYASPHAPITHDTLIELRRRLERWTIGTQRLDPAFEPDEQESARLYLSGMLALRAGDAAGTMQMRRRLLAIGSDSATRRMSAALAAGLLGHAALARGQPDVALAALQEAELHWPFARRGGSPVAEQLLERHARAEALLALGRHEEAERWYASLHDGYHLLGSPFLGASLMRRGEILEREGLRGEARETYERLLTLWKDADPEFAERRRVVEGRVVALQR